MHDLFLFNSREKTDGFALWALSLPTMFATARWAQHQHDLPGVYSEKFLAEDGMPRLQEDPGSDPAVSYVTECSVAGSHSLENRLRSKED